VKKQKFINKKAVTEQKLGGYQMKKLLILSIVSILGILIIGLSAVSAAPCVNTAARYCTVASDCAQVCRNVCGAFTQPCSGTYDASLGCFQQQCFCRCNAVTTSTASTSSSSSSVSSSTTSTTTTTTTTTYISDTCTVDSDASGAEAACLATYGSDTGRCKHYTKVAKRTVDGPLDGQGQPFWHAGDPICWSIGGINKCRCTIDCGRPGTTNGQGTPDLVASGNVAGGSFNSLILAMGEEYISVIEIENDKEIDLDDYPGFDPAADDARMYAAVYQDYNPETQELTKENGMSLQYNDVTGKYEARGTEEFNLAPTLGAGAGSNPDVCDCDPDNQKKTYTGDDGGYTPLGNGQVPEFSNWGLVVALAVIVGVMVVFYVKKKK